MKFQTLTELHARRRYKHFIDFGHNRDIFVNEQLSLEILITAKPIDRNQMYVLKLRQKRWTPTGLQITRLDAYH